MVHTSGVAYYEGPNTKKSKTKEKYGQNTYDGDRSEKATTRGMGRKEGREGWGDSPLEGDGEGRWNPSWRIFGWEMVEVKLERNDMLCCVLCCVKSCVVR